MAHISPYCLAHCPTKRPYCKQAYIVAEVSPARRHFLLIRQTTRDRDILFAMPAFNNLPSRATYRLLVTFFLVTTLPLLFYFLLLAINADLPGITVLHNPLALKIPIIVVCSLWILYVVSGAPSRRAWPLNRWGDAADLCTYTCPLMAVVLVCFCLNESIYL